MNPHRTIVENVLGRICKFNILRVPFRNPLDLHHVVFRVCAHIAQHMTYNPVRADVEFPDRHHLFDYDVPESGPAYALQPADVVVRIGA